MGCESDQQRWIMLRAHECGLKIPAVAKLLTMVFDERFTQQYVKTELAQFQEVVRFNEQHRRTSLSNSYRTRDNRMWLLIELWRTGRVTHNFLHALDSDLFPDIGSLNSPVTIRKTLQRAFENEELNKDQVELLPNRKSAGDYRKLTK